MNCSNTLTIPLKAESTKQLYNLIGKELSKRIPKSVVIVVHLDIQLKKGLVKGFYGLNMPWFNKLISVLGINPVGKHFELTEQGMEYYTHCHFRKFSGTIYEFAGGQIPEWITKSVEVLFNINEIYTIALNSGGNPLGTILVFNRLNTAPNFDGLDLFVQQSANELLDIINRNKKELKIRAFKDTFTKNLLSNLSHEIRTPLNCILGTLELVKTDVESNTAIDVSLFEHAWSNAYTLTRHIDSLVMASELTTNTLTLTKQHLTDQTILNLLRKIVNQTTHQYPTRKIHFDYKMPDGYSLMADTSRLEYMVEEILLNAIKFSENNVELTVRADEYFVLKVKDYGIGMSAEETELVFEHFAKIASCERIHRGMGLGLYICSELAKLHSGTITLDSTPNCGTTVSVRLPLANLN